MKRIFCTNNEWNPFVGGYSRDWIADDEDQLSAGFDPESNPGSTIYVISTKQVYIKNSQRKWQLCGSTEVLI